MAFTIVKNPKAWWPVIVPGVTEEGKAVTNEFKMRFCILDNEELTALATATSGAEASANQTEGKAAELTADFIMKLAEDWSGVEMAGEKGSVVSLPFTRENLIMMVGIPNVTDAIVRAYVACRAGEPEVRRGN